MRGVVGKELEEWATILFCFFEIINRPLGKESGGVCPFCLKQLIVVIHIVVPMTEVLPVVIHHVPNKTVKLFKAALIR